MKNKYLLVFAIALIVFSLTFITAPITSNTYDYINKEYAIKDYSNTKIAEIKLNTPLIYQVIRGSDRLIAEFEIDSYKNLDNVFNSMEFYDLNNKNQKINRNFKYKYVSSITENTIPVWTCGKPINNKTNCNYIYQTNYIKNWKDLDTSKTLKTGKITIGIFADVYAGDRIEWIPTILNNKLTAWAIWTESLDNGLLSYWDLDVDGRDAMGYKNLTEIGSPTHLDSGCKNKGCYNFTGRSTLKNITAGTGAVNYPTANLNSTMSLWMKTNNASTQIPFSYGVDDTLKNRIIRTLGTGITIGANGGTANIANGTMFNNEWHMITFIHQDNNTNTLWLDGTKVLNSDIVLNTLKGSIYIGGGENGGVFNNFTGAIDEVKIWNRTLSDTEIESLYNNGNGLFRNASTVSISLIHPTDDSQTLNRNIVFNSTLTPVTSNLTNATLYVWYSNDTLLNSTTNYLSGNISYTTNWTIRNFNLGSYTWNIYGCSNNSLDSYCDWALNNYTINVSNLIDNSQTFNSQTLSNTLESFTINISINPSYTLTSAKLIYNNTNYSSTAIDNYGSGGYIISKNITIPSVIVATNKTFYWEFILSDGNSYNSSFNNQTINIFALDDCSTYTNLLLNYTLFDEINKTVLSNANNPVTQIDLSLYASDYTTLIGRLNLTSNSNNTQICLLNELNTTSYYLDVTAQYQGSSNYATEFNYIQKAKVNGSIAPINVSLYDLLLANSTEFTVTFKDSNFVKKPNVLIDVTRKYVGEGLFRSVEVAKTDGNGQTIIHLQLSDTIYTINFIHNGIVLAVLDNVIAKCQNPLYSTCEINVNALISTTDIDDFTYVNGIALYEYYDEDTKTITANFISQSGTNTLTLNVTKFDRFGNETVCSDMLTSSSGTLSCIIPDSFGNSTVVSEVYSNNVLIDVRMYKVRTSNPDITYTWVILSLMIVITLSMLFITDIRGVLLGCFMGLILAGTLMYLNTGNLFVTGSAIMWLIIAGVIILWKVNRKEEQ